VDRDGVNRADGESADCPVHAGVCAISDRGTRSVNEKIVCRAGRAKRHVDSGVVRCGDGSLIDDDAESLCSRVTSTDESAVVTGWDFRKRKASADAGDRKGEAQCIGTCRRSIVERNSQTCVAASTAIDRANGGLQPAAGSKDENR